MTDRTITVDATAERSAPPETAVVEVAARGEGTTAAGARRAARDRAATLRETLADVVDPDRVRTTEFEVAETGDLFDAETDPPYRATERLAVDCAPETAEDVVVGVTDAGASVRGVEYALHEAARRERQDETLAAATERAREKAQRVAATEGLSLGELQRVETVEVGGRSGSGMHSIVDGALASGPASSVRPDPITVRATVEAVYELEN